LYFLPFGMGGHILAKKNYLKKVTAMTFTHTFEYKYKISYIFSKIRWWCQWLLFLTGLCYGHNDGVTCDVIPGQDGRSVEKTHRPSLLHQERLQAVSQCAHQIWDPVPGKGWNDLSAISLKLQWSHSSNQTDVY